MAHFAKKVKLTVSLALVSSFLLACEGNDELVDEPLVDGDQIELVHVSWEDSIATTNVVAHVLEDIGYDVTLTSVDATVLWQALADGETDASLSAWLPITNGAHEEEYGDQIENLGPHTHGAKIGLAVPTYMEDLNSIGDLDDQAGKTITGIESGSGIMNSSEEAMEVYDNLADWDLQYASTGAMISDLRTKYENQEEIVVTGWNPHWMFQEFDLKYLDDPENVYGDDETIHTLVRQGFEDDHPIAFSVLDNFEWEMDDLEAVVLELAETDDPELAAENWINENQEKVQEWISEAQELASESN